MILNLIESFLIAWHVTINPIYVHCGQSARDDIIDVIIHTYHTYGMCGRKKLAYYDCT